MFVGKAPQFDDLTMLCFSRTAPENRLSGKDADVKEKDAG